MAVPVRARRLAFPRPVRLEGPRADRLLASVTFLEPLDPVRAPLYAAEHGQTGANTYWAYLWPSSVPLALALLHLPLQGARVLELGAGSTGLAAWAAATAGADLVEPTDCVRAAVELLAVSAARQWPHLSARLRPAVLDWTLPATWPPPGAAALACASDVLYAPEHAQAVAALLRHATAPGGLALLTDAGRSPVPALLAALEQDGEFAVRSARAELALGRDAPHPVLLLAATRRGAPPLLPAESVAACLDRTCQLLAAGRFELSTTAAGADQPEG